MPRAGNERTANTWLYHRYAEAENPGMKLYVIYVVISVAIIRIHATSLSSSIDKLRLNRST